MIWRSKTDEGLPPREALPNPKYLLTTAVAAVTCDLDDVLFDRLFAVIAAVFGIARDPATTSVMSTFIFICHNNYPFY